MSEKAKKQKPVEESPPWQRLMEQIEEGKDYKFPKVTVVIPTYNCAQPIGFTLDSIKRQNYPNLELVIVDASSKDRTMEVVKKFVKRSDRIYSVSEYNIYDMINKGISLATGEYVNFLFPGGFYISTSAMRHLMKLALENEKPDLVYCGTLLRIEGREPQTFLRPLSDYYLKRGKQPASVVSCCFKTESIRALNRFSTEYKIRGDFELFFRLHENKKMTVAMSQFVLMDYERSRMTHMHFIRHSTETCRIISKYFGFAAAMRWWLVRNPFRFIKWWFYSIKFVFLGK